jgi:hypothetical protein
MINLKRIVKYTVVFVLFTFFLIQVFIFVTFELAAPGFMDGESSHWYNSVFSLAIPLNLGLLYWAIKK